MMWLGTSVMDRLYLSDGGLPKSLPLALWDNTASLVALGESSLDISGLARRNEAV